MMVLFPIRCPLMPTWPARRAAVLLFGALAACRGDAPSPAPQPPSPEPPRTAYIAYRDAQPILEAFKTSLPAPLAGKSPQELEAAWPAWTAAHDAAIRARLAQGDEDSVVNFWLYGASFTNQPRATAENLARLPRNEIENLLVARLDDLVRGMAAPGTERAPALRTSGRRAARHRSRNRHRRGQGASVSRRGS